MNNIHNDNWYLLPEQDEALEKMVDKTERLRDERIDSEILEDLEKEDAARKSK